MADGRKRTRSRPHGVAFDDSVNDTDNYKTAATAAIQRNVNINLHGDDYSFNTEPHSRATEYR